MTVSKTSSSHSAPLAGHSFWLRVESTARQYGFVLVVLLLLAGFCGLFSKGLFNNAHVASADGNVLVDYPRFGRNQSDMDLKLTLKVPPGESYTVTLGGQFMDAFAINALYPQPWRFSNQNGSMTLEFHDQPESKSQSLWLSIQPRSSGKIRSTLRVNHASTVAITQFIYP